MEEQQHYYINNNLFAYVCLFLPIWCLNHWSRRNMSLGIIIAANLSELKVYVVRGKVIMGEPHTFLGNTNQVMFSKRLSLLGPLGIAWSEKLGPWGRSSLVEQSTLLADQRSQRTTERYGLVLLGRWSRAVFPSPTCNIREYAAACMLEDASTYCFHLQAVVSRSMVLVVACTARLSLMFVPH